MVAIFGECHSFLFPPICIVNMYVCRESKHWSESETTTAHWTLFFIFFIFFLAVWYMPFICFLFEEICLAYA